MPGVADTGDNMKRCICGTCPSFMRDEGFYCARGKSPNTITHRGCVCADCENCRECLLWGEYFCDYGFAQPDQTANPSGAS
jgi:hypothetical protein